MSSPALYLLDTNIVIHYAPGKTVGQQIEANYSLLTTPVSAAHLRRHSG